MSRFDDDFGEVLAKFREEFGSVVTIRRGSRSTAAVTAQRFDGSGKMEDEDGVTVSVVYCEWVIAIAAYTFTGLGEVPPKAGDRITSDTDEDFEVAPVLNMKQVELLPGNREWLIRTRAVA